jgi:hypothetical protein
MINVKKDNAVIEVYKKYGLLSKKFIVLKVKFDTNNKVLGDEFIEAGLPEPTFIIHASSAYYIGWAIRGAIKTKAQKEFAKDLRIRLKLTLLKRSSAFDVSVSSIWALSQISAQRVLKTQNIYDLENLAQWCVSVSDSVEMFDEKEALVYAKTYEKTEDALFDFIREKVYNYIRTNGKKDRESLFEYTMQIALLGYEIIGSKKGISSVMSKARNIAKWCFENYTPGVNNWNYARKTKDDEELEMTRRENITRINKLRAEDRKMRVKQAVESLKFLGEKVSVRKVAQYANISTKTAHKYLKELNLL